jgi:hypothetical protein
MARIRSVHPGLFTDENFAQLTLDCPIAVPLLIGLWTEADDAGAFEWKPLTLKMRILPAAPVRVDDLLEVLAGVDLIRRFEIDGRTFGVIRNFVRWQRPKKPKDVHPYTAESRAYAGFVDGQRPRAGAGRRSEDEDDLFDEDAGEFRTGSAKGGTGSANGGTGSELGRQREEEGGRREESPPPPPPAGARASRDENRPFGELTGATVVALRTGDPFEAEARAYARGLRLALDDDFRPIAALVASGAATRGDVLAMIEQGRAKGENCPKFWATLAKWVRRRAGERLAAARAAAEAARGPPAVALAAPASPASAPPTPPGDPPWRQDFERVWNGFPRDPTASRPRAEAAFAALSPEEQRRFAASIGAIAEHIRRQKLSSPHNLATFIAERRFAGFATPPPTKAVVRVERDSPAGRAWEAYRRANGGRGVPWEAGGGHWGFETEFPPGYGDGAKAGAA